LAATLAKKELHKWEKIGRQFSEHHFFIALVIITIFSFTLSNLSFCHFLGGLNCGDILSALQIFE